MFYVGAFRNVIGRVTTRFISQVQISQTNSVKNSHVQERARKYAFLSGKKLLKTLLLPKDYKIHPNNASVFHKVNVAFCDILMKKCMENGYNQLAFEIFKAVIDKGEMEVDEFFFHRGVMILHDLGDFEGVKMLFEIIVLSGFVPREKTSILFFEACRKSRDFSKVTTILQEFKDRNIPIPTASYKYLMMPASMLENESLKNALFEELCSSAFGASTLNPKDLELVIQMGNIIGDFDRCMKAFKLLKSLGVVMKSSSYESLIFTSIAHGNLDFVKSLVEEIDDLRIEISPKCIEKLHEFDIKRKSFLPIHPALLKFIESFKEDNVQDANISTLLKELEFHWNEYDFEGSFDKLLAITVSSNRYPSLNVMEMILKKLMGTEKVKKVFQAFEFIKNNYNLSGTSVCSEMIRFLTTEKQFAGVLTIFNYMQSDPSVDHLWLNYMSKYTLALSACVKTNRLAEGIKIIDEMKHNSIPLDDNAAQSSFILYILDNRCDSALEIFDKFLENPFCDILQNPSTWGNMLKCLIKNKSYEAATRIYDTMKELRTERSLAAFAMAITLFRKIKNYDRAFEEFEELIALGLAPNLQIYSAMFTLCRNASAFEKGERFYEDSVKNGVILNVKALTPLIQMRIESKNFQGASDLLLYIEKNYPEEFLNDEIIKSIRSSLEGKRNSQKL
jgi:pentatricopeptide repeat protein